MTRLAVGSILALLLGACTLTIEVEPFPASTRVAIRELNQATGPVWSGRVAAGERELFSFAGRSGAALRACLQTAGDTPGRLEVFDSRGLPVASVDEAAAAAQAIIPVPGGLCLQFRADSTGQGFLRATNRGGRGDNFTLFLHYR